MNRQAFVSRADVAAPRPIWTAFLTGLLREIVAQERFQPLNNPDDGGTITQKTWLGARGERGDAGLATEKRSSLCVPKTLSENLIRVDDVMESPKLAE